jgi:hypothetical protein
MFGLVMATSARAVTVMTDGDTFSIPSDDTEFIGVVVSTADGAGSWTVTFDPSSDLFGNAQSSITSLVSGTFSGLTMAWLDAPDDSVLSSTPITSIITTLGTTFTSPDLPSQKLQISWTNSLAGAGFDTEAVFNPVPLPAAVWLFGSGLLGLIGMARRKKAA